MAETITGKIKRKFMANYIDAALPSEPKESYVRLGKDLEEYIVEMNANVETKNNIWGETSVTLDSYQPQASVEPYYAETGEPLFERLQGIVDEQQTLDDLKTSVVEVHLWDPVEAADGTYVAYKEDAIIEVSSYGGDTTGYQIPFNVHHTGNRVKGKFVLATKTFTADT
ncbi:hypothetical protein [Enterocloster citroniae]|uniref:hypothetical protein n=1 Tax=Enterocloster citroniae TaxID=358743 RepID=UPI0022E20F22|nr:hypothetical protein [Enterocloster citroniae]